MNRQQKELVIDLFHKSFSTSKGSFFVDYCGLTVFQMQQLRRQLRQSGGALKIAKMRLVKRALKNTVGGFDALASYCKNQVGVVFAHDDSGVSAIAKTLTDFAKKNAALSLVVGCLEEQILDRAAIIRVASLPSRDVLLAQLCGTLKAPLAKLAFVLREVQRQKEEM